MFTSLEPSAKELRAFGLRVRKRREVMGISQTELSRQAKCSVKHVNNIECGRTWPSLHLHRALCRALKVGEVPLFAEAA